MEKRIQEFYKSVITSGVEPLSEYKEADRESAGTYSRGGSESKKIWKLKKNGLPITARLTTWSRFCPSFDKSGERFLLKVEEGNQVVFLARKEGSSKTEKFGAQERYIGSESIDEQVWVVVEGKVNSLPSLATA